MPTIEVSQKILNKLSGRVVRESDLHYAKACLEEKKGDLLKIEISDTNRPDLWSVEGISRVLRGFYGKKTSKLSVKHSGKKIIVDKNIMKIRPFIAGFAAKNLQLSEELLKDIVQMQEKLSENYGKKRKKISIGVYNYDKITFPVHYKLVSPGLKFVPLDFDKPHSLHEILEKHPKGVEYGYIIKHHDLFPIFVDSSEHVLSFPPIINSDYLGRVTPGMSNVFVEVTGTEQKSVLLAANIVAYALHDRDAVIESCETVYPQKTAYGSKVNCPAVFNASLEFKKRLVKEVLGLQLDDNTVKTLLEKMQYNAKISKDAVIVNIPDYRNDVMHGYDVLEDMAIAYGYENFKSVETNFFTLGRLDKSTEFLVKIKNIMAGLGFQEILSPVLSSKKSLEEKMCTTMDSIEIENVMSENYSAVRSWMLPSLMHFLSKNLHIDYPQFVFEVGGCVVKSKGETLTKTKLAAAITGTNIGYQNMSSVLHAFMKQLGIDYKFGKSSHAAFMEGRTADVISGKQIGVIGEIHPAVLNNWSLEKPVVAFEIDVDELRRLHEKNK